jgi:hypothetical protein
MLASNVSLPLKDSGGLLDPLAPPQNDLLGPERFPPDSQVPQTVRGTIHPAKCLDQVLLVPQVPPG